MREKTENILWALESRRSIRAFKEEEVSQNTLKKILQAAARAPSGTNIQPWKVYVLTGQRKDAVVNACMTAHEQGDPGTEHYDYYPNEWCEPYISRRRQVGMDMYGLLNIQKGDKEGMHKQFGQNYLFFGAPVGLFFTIDKNLSQGSWFDYGMFVQNIMIAARAFGLSTCPQQAFAKYSDYILPLIEAGNDEVLICGMALGYEDEGHIVNQLKTEREPVDDFACFLSE